MELTVTPLTTTESGRFAEVGREVLAELGVESDGYVRVSNHGDDAVVRVSVPDDTENGAVGLDGELRDELGVELQDRVTVEPTTVEPADRIRVALPEEFGPLDVSTVSLREHLTTRIVREGAVITIPDGGGSASGSRRLPVEVVETRPSGAVVVREWTDIRVSEEPVEELTPETPREGVGYDDIGGLDDEIHRIREVVDLPLHHPAVFERLHVDPPHGLLLYGPPGTGKTLITRAVADGSDAFVATVSGPAIAAANYGESERRLQQAFEKAAANAPAIVLIGELDAIAPGRDDASEAERRMAAQLTALIDEVERRVVVVATTNRIDGVAPALRRPGRFDREIEVGVPDADGRTAILDVHTRGMPLADDIDLGSYAERTHGFVGADIENLVREAAMKALERVRPTLDGTKTPNPDALDSLYVTDADMAAALEAVEPSGLREVFVEIPDVSWADVGGLDDTKNRLREAIEWPLAYPEAFERAGVHTATGVMLHGPPGTGKTLLAKAVATEASSNFIPVKGPELLDKYVGESERGVREVFSKATENAPTVVFFDEIDAIAGERGEGTSDAGVSERVVSQLLTELDGLEDRGSVVVIAATNRPDLIDDALLRPGRLDTHIHVAVPDEAARREIFAVHTRNKPLTEDVDLADLAARTAGYVGADIEAMCREAAMAAVRAYVDSTARDVGTIHLTADHFEHALATVEPSGTDVGKEERV